MNKIISLLLCFVLLISLAACGTNNQTSTTLDNEEKESNTSAEGGIKEYPFDEPITALDNEFVCIQITGKMFVDPENSGDWMMKGGAVGYSFIIENKITDASIEVLFVEPNVNGFMLDFQAGPYSTINSFSAGTKGKGYLYIPLDGRDLGVDIASVEDLHDFNSKVALYFSEDGTNFTPRKYHGQAVPDTPLLTKLP